MSKYLFAVGRVTDVAREKIEAAAGSVTYISSVPSVMLIRLENVVMEYQEFYTIRLISNGVRLLWRGDHPGPELTSVDKTSLAAEYGEPHEEAETTEDVSLDDLTDPDKPIF